jgi:hypothetical protein
MLLAVRSLIDAAIEKIEKEAAEQRPVQKIKVE